MKNAGREFPAEPLCNGRYCAGVSEYVLVFLLYGLIIIIITIIVGAVMR